MQAQAKSPFEHPLARVAFITSLSFHNSTGLPPLQDYNPGKYGAFNVYSRSWKPLPELTSAVFGLEKMSWPRIIILHSTSRKPILPAARSALEGVTCM
jgi:hypothetical protein